MLLFCLEPLEEGGSKGPESDGAKGCIEGEIQVRLGKRKKRRQGEDVAMAAPKRKVPRAKQRVEEEEEVEERGGETADGVSKEVSSDDENEVKTLQESQMETKGEIITTEMFTYVCFTAYVFL